MSCCGRQSPTELRKVALEKQFNKVGGVAAAQRLVQEYIALSGTNTSSPRIGIFYGSDTGNTEAVARKIANQLSKTFDIHIQDIAETSKENMESFEVLLLGASTWFYGELQSDFDDFLPELQQIDFSNKIVGIFGCGDQEDYGDSFCDGMGIIRSLVEKSGGRIIGVTSTEGYHFEASQAVREPGKFCGLCIDEDRQPELTDERIREWVERITHMLHPSF